MNLEWQHLIPKHYSYMWDLHFISYITNIVVFNARIGLHLNGSSNSVQGIHIWGINASPDYNDTNIGLLLDGWPHLVRFMDSYMDGCSILVSGSIYLLNILNTEFLGGARLILAPDSPNAEILSFAFRNSIYSGQWKVAQPTIEVMVLDANKQNKYKKVNDMVVDSIQTNQQDYILKTTASQDVLTLTNSTKWTFDFSNVLLFENIEINNIEYSIKMAESSANKFVQHYASVSENNKVVTIITDKICDATMYIKVDQSLYGPSTW